MAKISKEKFDHFGQHEGRTTFKGKLELDLYYNGLDHHFYFDADDIKKKLPDVEINTYSFRVCDTRDKALNMVKALVESSLNPKKVLALTLNTGTRALSTYIDARPKEVKDKALRLALNISSDDNGIYGYKTNHVLGIQLNRYYVYELSEKREDDLLLSVSPSWRLPSIKRYSTRREYEKSLIIDWTPEREKYLVSVCERLNNLGATLLLFLAQGIDAHGSDFGKFIDNGVSQFVLDAHIKQ